ncbi:hypothetical protein CEV32_0480 [Brucella rhizosphaerae]|uniref:Uncharacterized protein n=1 Tax=Brucella rhizosphaerae TaxID=571254 RepID=A0A256FHY3_9HYPH|nr:hypothetical protein CEV32_0480 [Brucella rhizosphaerae]
MRDHFSEFDGEDLVPTRVFPTIASIFQAAREMIVATHSTLSREKYL